MRKIRLTLIARRVSVSRTIYFELNEEGHRAARRAKSDVRYTQVEVTPMDAITMALAGASNKAARFLHKRNVQREDREDILNDALLWCWENRNSYSLTTSLDTWFVNAVRDAYKRYRRRMDNGNL
ncbi:MAG TPA: hypothetical protein VKB76_11850 [Ktedonobacterales bacterium]|nr:hypothetical protein [Ktedonobacterales bacterium]